MDRFDLRRRSDGIEFTGDEQNADRLNQPLNTDSSELDQQNAQEERNSEQLNSDTEKAPEGE